MIVNIVGIWASKKISHGSKFGPFEGNKVQEASDNMDSAFVWEVGNFISINLRNIC